MSESARTPDQTELARPRAQNRPDGGFAPPRTETGPNFGPPAQAGELGTFGRYRVLEKLGQGGMGAVYLGYDAALGRKVALKLMLPRHAADPESRDRFIREARLAAAINSDHVVTIFDVGEERNLPFIAMEYLLGFPLDQYLRTKGELPLPHALRIGYEVALGLVAAHDRGMIHRDIKPGNVWLEAPKGRVKILDFGLARAQDDDTRITGTGLVVGTPAFMSPEQARGHKLDGRSDLFSLGVMLYRLCTGKMPFDGPTTMAVLTALAVDTPAPPRALNPHLPEAVARVITRLLAKGAGERYPTAQAAADALLGAGRAPSAERPVVVVPLTVAAQPQNVWENIDASGSTAVPLPSGSSADALSEPVPAPRPRSSRLPLVLAGAAVGLAVVVVGAVLMWPEKRPEAAHAEPPKPAAPERKVAPPKVTDPERKAAEFALGRGAEVRAVADGKETIARQVADLPPGRFVITGLELRGRQWTTEDMDAFRDLPGLTRLALRETSVTEPGLSAFRGTTRVEELALETSPFTDVGIGNLNGNKGLRALSIRGIGITEYGLSFFADCTRLVRLTLNGANIPDAGLVYLERMTALEALDLRGTKVTDAGVKALAAKLPGCRIEWDGGVVGPPADAQAARWVLAAGGAVEVTGAAGYITRVDPLPPEPFRLTGVVLSRCPVTDADLDRFRHCPDLVALHLGSCAELTDAGLAAFAGRDNLVALALPGCLQVTDAGLAHFKNCKGLTVLALQGCRRVTDAGLAHFAGCPALGALNLAYCFRVTDAGLAHFKGAAALRHLNLHGCASVTDAGLAHFGDSRDLETLFLNDCPQISDAGLEPFKGCAGLLDVQLQNTSVADAGVARLAGCKGLKRLGLRNTRVTDGALDHLSGIALLDVDLRGTKVTAARVDALRKARPECHVGWDR